jgi:hypothetical protein
MPPSGRQALGRQRSNGEIAGKPCSSLRIRRLNAIEVRRLGRRAYEADTCETPPRSWAGCGIRPAGARSAAGKRSIRPSRLPMRRPSLAAPVGRSDDTGDAWGRRCSGRRAHACVRPHPRRLNAIEVGSTTTCRRQVRRRSTAWWRLSQLRRLIAAKSPHWPEKAENSPTLAHLGANGGLYPLTVRRGEPSSFYLIAAV